MKIRVSTSAGWYLNRDAIHIVCLDAWLREKGHSWLVRSQKLDPPKGINVSEDGYAQAFIGLLKPDHSFIHPVNPETLKTNRGVK
jgi:hypothetical protein